MDRTEDLPSDVRALQALLRESQADRIRLMERVVALEAKLASVVETLGPLGSEPTPEPR